jgi:hypothetical protein
MSLRNPRQRTPARGAEHLRGRAGSERHHVVFPYVVQHQQSSAPGKPLFSGSDLLLGRPGLNAQLELGHELSRDFGDGTLAAHESKKSLEVYQHLSLESANRASRAAWRARRLAPLTLSSYVLVRDLVFSNFNNAAFSLDCTSIGFIGIPFSK